MFKRADFRQYVTHSCMFYLYVKSVLKLHVQFCLIASLIARVHGKVRSLSKS